MRDYERQINVSAFSVKQTGISGISFPDGVLGAVFINKEIDTARKSQRFLYRHKRLTPLN